ncbi:hypothetical protein EXM22_04210 [Oceanispirochaeta crateris]|uniref:DUF5067 domain-containing protein n=1 Tax=Oceanispirochaeta crateris TaxID=2518645 RepID=A0A5C1QJ88_9SPIO|nr:hypothetical protein [Oceanispirochaeta crateris]QEN07229.1 hypothetical protein EXM22_04210 [Oceanispirochaeta crateris]
MQYQENRYFKRIILLLLLTLLVSSCFAESTIGFYTNELSSENYKIVDVLFWDWFPQKKEVEDNYDSVQFYYKSNRTYKDYSGTEKELVLVGYLVGVKNETRFILAKYTPTAVYDANGNTLSEIPETSKIYKSIIGLNGDILEDPTAVAPVIDKNGETEVDSFALLEFDFANNTMVKYIIQLD